MTNDNLTALFQLLVDHEVPFVVIGGHAVNFHGYVRSTEDIDLVFKRTAQTEKRLLKVFNQLNAFWIGDELDPKTGLEKTHPVSLEFIKANHVLMIGTKFGYVDLFDFVPGLPDASLDEFFEESVTKGSYRFASLRWLRRLKEAAGRPQDLIDLQQLPNDDRQSEQ